MWWRRTKSISTRSCHDDDHSTIILWKGLSAKFLQCTTNSVQVSSFRLRILVVHTWELDTHGNIQSAARPTFLQYSMAMFDSFGPLASRGPGGGTQIQLTRPTQYQFQNKKNVSKSRWIQFPYQHSGLQRGQIHPVMGSNEQNTNDPIFLPVH